MIAALTDLPILPPAFFRRPTVVVARALLGKVLVVVHDGEVLGGALVEVEAYLGTRDPASHAFKGRTKRNGSMFEDGGTCYIYFSYGMHCCMNVVTRAAGVGEAVLIRAIAPLAGLSTMARLRGLPELPPTPRATEARRFTGGPGKVTAALGLTLGDDGRRFDEPTLRLVDPGTAASRHAIVSGPRIGISKAVDLPLRFYLKDSPWVSR